MKCTVIIPTVDREASLVQAVLSCAAQLDEDAEIVVVDNSPAGRQAWVVQAVRGQSPTTSATLRYVHEPRAGLAYARNRGVSEAHGAFVAFLDDDQVPGSGWIGGLVDALDRTSADAAFGPVIARFTETPALEDFATGLYTRRLAARPDENVASRFNYLGTGNSCFRAATCFRPEIAPFDTRFNATGGEDTEFLRRLWLEGRRFVWVDGAAVEEVVPTARATVHAMAARRFAQGQLRSYTHVASVPRRFDKTALWMAAGAVQYGGHSVLALAHAIAGRRDAAAVHRIKAQGGLGKVLWGPRFRKSRYGVKASE